MDAISLPNRAIVNDLGNNKFSVVLEPLYPGYGVTIGNTMRRVLLSSLPGAAVTMVKIKFVDHEFSTIPNIKEDVIQIILNLKQLRVKSRSSEPVRLFLKVKGEKIVTASDIKETDLVEIISKDLHIATLDNKNSELDMELVVEQGRGYLPVEARENVKMELGMIAVDSIFTPVKSVHFDITNVRVGQLTNFDKLEIIIETDGTITGQEAINIASHILIDHFSMMFPTSFGMESESSQINASNNKQNSTDNDIVEALASDTEDEISQSILSNRAKNALNKAKILTMAKLKSMSTEEISNLDGLGDKTIKEILEYLGK
jgi:DNA-directed RNA polymerase subunit alpha